MQIDWIKEFPAAATVIDRDGVILAFNDKALQIFAEDGGEKLLGSNALDCHPEPSRSMLKTLLETAGTHVYVIEKDNTRTMIYQAPWYQDGVYAGIVELELDLPADLPSFVRG